MINTSEIIRHDLNNDTSTKQALKIAKFFKKHLFDQLALDGVVNLDITAKDLLHASRSRGEIYFSKHDNAHVPPKLIGAVSVSNSADFARSTVDMIAVDPAYRGQGHEYELMQVAATALKANRVVATHITQDEKELLDNLGFTPHDPAMYGEVDLVQISTGNLRYSLDQQLAA